MRKVDDKMKVNIDTYGSKIRGGELTHNHRRFLTSLIVNELIGTVQSAHALHFASIHSLLLELLTKLELDGGALEGGRCVEGVLIASLHQLHCG